MGHQPIRIMISGGGTGGHVFPALAIAKALQQKEPKAELLFVGARGRLEMQVVPAAGYRIVGLPIAGLQRKFDMQNFLLPFKLLASCWKALALMRQFRPHVVIGVGGYASFPVLLMAVLLGIPTLIHEQNSYAGLANRLLGRWVRKVCVAYEGMERFFPRHKIVLTGNPVRQELLQLPSTAQAREVFGFRADVPVVLVVGGSLGAASINQSIAEGIDRLLEAGFQILWQTGKIYYEQFRLYEKKAPQRLRILPFVNDMAAAYAAADLVVSRAGALALAELSVTAKAAVLVPSPHVAEDHQRRNAEELARHGAAVLIADAEAPQLLVDNILKLMRDEPTRHRLSQNISTLARPHAHQALATEILELVNKKSAFIS
ncbi:MAG: undecaprenyldiphospho-muramoylpentapeptide beta-N-acetylglucosaminyltransferase [Chitinophagales bacterium]|nr:undecaprenyldiphospho-muramoylpentapeptide beta-N-acetylglucosaminyltransferase [Chitinophagales bacterium]MDW8428739.1 undecaprenyldiphospho-muramoylpentapeptide beta-N-acetylglucosaminyltransferase [Chitinophagales bacterium]